MKESIPSSAQPPQAAQNPRIWLRVRGSFTWFSSRGFAWFGFAWFGFAWPCKVSFYLIEAMKPPIFTIGHSTHSIEEFLKILKAYDITRLVDIRTVPRSRHNPQFNREALPAALKRAHIRYSHLAGLGGLRHARKDSKNTGWHNASFRGFADYMETSEFEKSLEQLIDLSKTDRVAVMCAEAVPWRCHRSLVADALAARRVPVEHIMSLTKSQPHKLTGFALVRGNQVTYPGEPSQLTLAAES